MSLEREKLDSVMDFRGSGGVQRADVMLDLESSCVGEVYGRSERGGVVRCYLAGSGA